MNEIRKEPQSVDAISTGHEDTPVGVGELVISLPVGSNQEREASCKQLTSSAVTLEQIPTGGWVSGM